MIYLNELKPGMLINIIYNDGPKIILMLANSKHRNSFEMKAIYATFGDKFYREFQILPEDKLISDI